MKIRFHPLLAATIGLAVTLSVAGSDAYAQRALTHMPSLASLNSDADAPGQSEACACLPFDVRVHLGEEAERKEEFRTYRSAMDRAAGDRFAETMRSCFAETRNPETTAFVLVADITAEGTARAVQVQPATNIATCFAAGFAAVSFPPPPLFPDHDGFPITINMRIQ